MDLSVAKFKVGALTQQPTYLSVPQCWPSLIKSDRGSDWTQQSRESLLIRHVIEESGPHGGRKLLS